MQTLTINHEQYAVVRLLDYEKLLGDFEDKQDAQDVLNYQAQLKNGKEEAVPAEFAQRLISGENPCMVWREYRQLKLKDISKASGIDMATLSRIENNKRAPSVKQLQKIAEVLAVDIDDLI